MSDSGVLAASLTSPVQQALVNAKLREQEQERATFTNAVAKRLGVAMPQGDRSEWPTWAAWCSANKIDAYPALPATLAIWILNNVGLGIEKIEKVVASISAVHANVADPTLSPLVSAALNTINSAKPPHSWDKAHAIMFARLPRDLQLYISKREADRDKAVRQAQNRKAPKDGSTLPHSPATADQITN